MEEFLKRREWGYPEKRVEGGGSGVAGGRSESVGGGKETTG